MIKRKRDIEEKDNNEPKELVLYEEWIEDNSPIIIPETEILFLNNEDEIQRPNTPSDSLLNTITSNGEEFIIMRRPSPIKKININI